MIRYRGPWPVVLTTGGFMFGIVGTVNCGFAALETVSGFPPPLGGTIISDCRDTGLLCTLTGSGGGGSMGRADGGGGMLPMRLGSCAGIGGNWNWEVVRVGDASFMTGGFGGIGELPGDNVLGRPLRAVSAITLLFVGVPPPVAKREVPAGSV